MAKMLAILALMAVGSAEALASHRSQSELRANPIRKVVTMLQAMQAKVTKEGEQEKELYEKFMCYCKTSGGKLGDSIAAAEAKGPQVSSGIEAAEGKLSQLKEDLKKAQTDRSAAKTAMSEATAIREKEAAAFAAEKAEADTNIAAMGKAIGAIEKGMGGAFLQTNDAQVLKKLVLSKQDMLDADRADITAFLSEGSDDAAPSSGEITGILKTMLETMEKGLAEATAEEEGAIKAYEGLITAKTKEVEALTAAIEAKTGQIGELGVEIVQMKEDLSDTAAQLEADKKFMAELEKGCKTKTAEWEERQKVRAQELVALADTIKVLNDDDALDLFKKTLPGASSLLQVSVSSAAMRDRAMAVVRSAVKAADKKDRKGLQMLVLALAGKKSLSQGGFDKVIKMIDEMVEVLKAEQLDDEHKKEYCEAQFDQAEDKKKGLEREISDAEHAIETCMEGIATLTEEIAALEKKIKDLDKDVADQTEQRKEENEEFKALMQSDGAAKELLGFAKNRLNKFYNPKLYKAPPKQELSNEDRIAVNMGSMEEPTTAPSGIAGTGVAVFAQIRAHTQSVGAPPPPPETFGAYTKKSEESGGVITMIDMLIADLDKEMTEAKTAEKDAQADYETFMEDCASTRTTDSKSLADKGAAKAELEGNLEDSKAAKAAGSKELMGVEKYISSLHAECDWLLQYFDVRKEARTGEIDALVKAKAVLSGADYSLLQTRGLRVRSQ